MTPGQGQGLPQQPQPPANSPTPCVTVGGPSSGKNCIFPFKHKGQFIILVVMNNPKLINLEFQEELTMSALHMD